MPRRLASGFPLAFARLLLAAALLGVGSRRATADAFLLVPGVSGEAADSAHLNWIELDSAQSLIFSQSNRAGGQVVLSKYLDRSTPELFKRCLAGVSLPSVTIELSTGTNRFYQLRLANVKLLQVSSSATDSRPREILSLGYSLMDWTYVDGLSPASTNWSVFWDFAKARGATRTAPSDRDLDRDGLTDLDDADMDGDGIPDLFELAHGLNLQTNDSRRDLDGDGLTNLEEYLRGTDPEGFNPSLNLRQIDEKTAELSFYSPAKKTWQIQSATAPQGPYRPYEKITANVSGTVKLQVPVSSTRFFNAYLVQ